MKLEKIIKDSRSFFEESKKDQRLVDKIISEEPQYIKSLGGVISRRDALQKLFTMGVAFAIATLPKSLEGSQKKIDYKNYAIYAFEDASSQDAAGSKNGKGVSR